METNPSAPLHTPPGSPAVRIGWAALICFALFVGYFSHLGVVGLTGPDEPRYAWIARDMAESGDWVTPRLYGQPWFEKPVLYYWGAAASFKIFGVSEAAARLPSAISALLATLGLAWLAWRVYGPATARWFLLILPVSVGMVGFSHAAATDMPFSAMIALAMVAAAVILNLAPETPPCPGSPESPTRLWAARLAFGFFLGLAALAKGPAALILCGGATLSWALFSGRWRHSIRLAHPVCILAFCATSLPWYLICSARNPDFFRVFLIEHNFKRFLTPEFQHVQPFWFYLPVMLVATLPWMPILFLAAKDYWPRRAAQSNDLNLFLICWIVFVVVFFTVSKSKLPGYVLPALPPAGLLAAQAISLQSRSQSSGRRWLAISVGLVLLFLSVALAFTSDHLPLSIGYFPPSALMTLALLDFLAAVLAILLGLFRRLPPAMIVAVVAFCFTILFGFRGDAAAILDQRLSSRVAVRSAGRHDPDWPAHAATYKLNRAFLYSLNFYGRRELPAWTGYADRVGWVFTSKAGLDDLRAQGYQCPDSVAAPAVILCAKPSYFAERTVGGSFSK